MKYYVVLLNTILAFQVTRPIEAFSISISPALPVRIRTKSTLHRQANDNEDKFVSLGDDELDEATLAEVEAGKPSNWMVIQRMFGINIFTYILAAAIAFFFSMNVMLGPGWLGNQIGIPSTGTFDEMSNSLPQTIDLSDPEYLI